MTPETRGASFLSRNVRQKTVHTTIFRQSELGLQICGAARQQSYKYKQLAFCFPKKIILAFFFKLISGTTFIKT